MEGLFQGLYKGFTASAARESSYSSLRLGLYEPFKILYGGNTDPAHTPIWVKQLAGVSSGLVGSALANPTDIVKVRMQAWKEEPHNLRWHVRHIYSNWGVGGFYVGVKPTVIRAMLLNGTQLATYDEAKHSLINAGYFVEGPTVHFVASFIAGIAVAVVTSPVDLVKTRVMNVDPANPAYSSMTDCFKKTIKSEGVRGLYKGFNAQWLRVGPLTMIQFMVWEQLRHLFGIAAV